MILNSLTLGFIFSLLGFGVFLSFKILNFTDLTAEASFTLGAAISVMMVNLGLPEAGLLLAILGGAGAGFITAFLHQKLHIDKVLSGILTLTAFYTINLLVTGFVPNLSLAREIRTIFPRNQEILNFFLSMGFALLLGVGLIFFFKSRLGISIRASGDNEDVVTSSGKSVDFYQAFGLMLSNGLIALSGALFMQYQRYYDSTFGTGMMIVGVSCIVIGEIFTFKKHELSLMVSGIILGSLLYRMIYLLVISFLGQPQYMKLVSALSIIVFLVLSKSGFFLKRRHRRASHA